MAHSELLQRRGAKSRGRGPGLLEPAGVSDLIESVVETNRIMGCWFSKPKASKADKYKVDGEEKSLVDATNAPTAAAAVSAEAVSKPAEGAAPKPAAAVAGASKGDSRIASLPGAKKKLDPADFKFVNLKGQVKDCDIYVLDQCAQVTIDECVNCRIFIGPTDGSIFIRDSKQCKCAFITRQLRTRDCVDCDIALITRPIIESSSNIGFSCFNFNYEALPAQMKAAKLSVFHNFWSHIYDFTTQIGNWHITDHKAGAVESLLFASGIPEEAKQAFGASHGAEGPLTDSWGDRTPPPPPPPPSLGLHALHLPWEEGSLIDSWGDRTPPPSPDFMFVVFPESKGPLIDTWGDRTPPPSPDYTFVVFPESKVDHAIQFSNQAKLETSDAERIGNAIGFEVSGAGCHEKLRGVVQTLGGYDTESEEVGAMFRYLGIDG
eukprot:gene461-1867_t